MKRTNFIFTLSYAMLRIIMLLKIYVAGRITHDSKMIMAKHECTS